MRKNKRNNFCCFGMVCFFCPPHHFSKSVAAVLILFTDSSFPSAHIILLGEGLFSCPESETRTGQKISPFERFSDSTTDLSKFTALSADLMFFALSSTLRALFKPFKVFSFVLFLNINSFGLYL